MKGLVQHKNEGDEFNKAPSIPFNYYGQNTDAEEEKYILDIKMK